MAGISTTTPASPSHSPRLPSPPPLTEVQFGPRSPSLGGDNTNTSKGGKVIDLDGAATSGDGGGGGGSTSLPAGVAGTGAGTEGEGSQGPTRTRRIRPGTSAEEMNSGPTMIPLQDLDSAFQLQEHLKSLYYSHTQPKDQPHTIPMTRSTALELAMAPEGVDRSLWLYELCRLLTLKLNTIIVAFFTDEPPCSASTCPEMRASEWQYLCAVHDPPKPCCAIDYSCHTLDWAANMLTSPKHFPSRLTLGSAGHTTTNRETGSNGQDPSNKTEIGVTASTTTNSSSSSGHQQGLRNLTNICRRLYRIFAHAWYQHRAVFWQVESQTGLYVFFKTVCDVYQLIPEDNYTVPAEAEGFDTDPTGDDNVNDKGNGDESGEGKGEKEMGWKNTSIAASSFSAAPTILRKHQPQLSSSSSVIGNVQANARDSQEEDLPSSSTAGTEEDRTTDPSTTTGNASSSSSSSLSNSGPTSTRRYVPIPSLSLSSVVTTVLEENETENETDNEQGQGAEKSRSDEGMSRVTNVSGLSGSQIGKDGQQQEPEQSRLDGRSKGSGEGFGEDEAAKGRQGDEIDEKEDGSRRDTTATTTAPSDQTQVKEDDEGVKVDERKRGDQMDQVQSPTGDADGDDDNIDTNNNNNNDDDDDDDDDDEEEDDEEGEAEDKDGDEDEDEDHDEQEEKRRKKTKKEEMEEEDIAVADVPTTKYTGKSEEEEKDEKEDEKKGSSR